MVDLGRPRRSRGRWIALAVGLALVGSVAVYTPLVLGGEPDAVVAQVSADAPAPGAALEFAQPDSGSVAIGPLDGDDVIWSYPDDRARPMASITKLITAFAVLEKHPLGPEDDGPSIAFTRADQAIYDKYWLEGVKILPFTAGTSYSERELLDIALIESAANYTDRLVTWAFGSRSAYLSAARAWLDEHGLGDITVVDPIGLDDDNTATPSQLLRLGRLAMADPVISQIVGTRAESIDGLGSISNTNPILGREGVDGIKTGNLEGHGSNLLFSAQLETSAGIVPVVGVVLGGDDVGDTALSLLAALRDSYRIVPVVQADAVVARYETPWGESSDVVAAESASLLVQGDTAISIDVQLDPLESGLADDQVGEAVYSAAGETVRVPLVLARDLRGPDIWWRLTHPAEVLG